MIVHIFLVPGPGFCGEGLLPSIRGLILGGHSHEFFEQFWSLLRPVSTSAQLFSVEALDGSSPFLPRPVGLGFFFVFFVSLLSGFSLLVECVLGSCLVL